MVVATLEHFMQIHPSDTFGCFLGVVVVVDIDHEAAQQFAHLAGHLDFQLIQLTILEMVGDVVVGEVSHASCIKTVANTAANRSQLAGNA